jgi:hypothetical protein
MLQLPNLTRVNGATSTTVVLPACCRKALAPIRYSVSPIPAVEFNHHGRHRATIINAASFSAGCRINSMVPTKLRFTYSIDGGHHVVDQGVDTGNDRNILRCYFPWPGISPTLQLPWLSNSGYYGFGALTNSGTLQLLNVA